MPFDALYTAGVFVAISFATLGLGQPIHVANMAVYLASDESEITTGQILSVDSGVTIY